MREHYLKTWPAYFEEIAAGRLPFSVRDNHGRGFQRGDIAVLWEWDPNVVEKRMHTMLEEPVMASVRSPRGYTGRVMRLEITYVESAWGVTPGHVVLGFGANVARLVETGNEQG